MSQRGVMMEAAEQLEQRLGALHPAEPALAEALARGRADLAALRFHLRYPGTPPLLVILGGTGTGKSTLLNRLLGTTLSATSYRRTFTAGPIAVTLGGAQVPPQWLAVEHRPAVELPARGHPDSLIIVDAPRPGGPAVVLVDTPDLDGDQPAHHAAADRAFRWATGIVFVVTPEKYQMTELLPYYRLARRYGLGAWFIMNKAEQAEVVDDYARQLAERDWPDARVFAVERDDSTFVPPPERALAALRQALMRSAPADPAARAAGLDQRRRDLVNRLVDQVLAPLRERRGEIDRAARALRAMEEPASPVDVNPLTEQLRERLRQRSILYLMGPQRMLDRVRQVPGMILRLPRSMWDLARGRKLTAAPADAAALPATAEQAPDFAAALRDQFITLQNRIEDVLRSGPILAARLSTDSGDAVPPRIDPAEAARIADEEIAALRAWLEQRWNANPRDTLLVMKLLRYLPGGQQITRAVEAAPYLLLIVFVLHPGHALHEAIFGAGYAVVTHVMERLSNEVTNQTRATNRRIAQRFAELAHRQIEQTVAWLDTQAPSPADLAELERSLNRLADAPLPRF